MDHSSHANSAIRFAAVTSSSSAQTKRSSRLHITTTTPARVGHLRDTVAVKLRTVVRLAPYVLLLFALPGVGMLVQHRDATTTLAVLLIVTIFVGIPAWVHGAWPKRLDEQGCTLGFGRRFLWSDLQNVRVAAQKRGAYIVNFRFELTFKGGTGRFGLGQLQNAQQVVWFLERITNRKLLPD